MTGGGGGDDGPELEGEGSGGGGGGGRGNEAFEGDAEGRRAEGRGQERGQSASQMQRTIDNVYVFTIRSFFPLRPSSTRGAVNVSSERVGTDPDYSGPVDDGASTRVSASADPRLEARAPHARSAHAHATYVVAVTTRFVFVVISTLEYVAIFATNTAWNMRRARIQREEARWGHRQLRPLAQSDLPVVFTSCGTRNDILNPKP
jgi:hypothetical protein